MSLLTSPAQLRGCLHACSLGVLLAVVSAGCRTTRPGVSGEQAQVELRDTLGPLVAELKAQADNVPEGPRAAWLAYEAAHLPTLRAAGALADDPGEQLLAKLAASPEAIRTLLEPVHRHGVEDAERLVGALEEKLGRMPSAVLVFGAAREWKAVFRGTEGGRPLTLLNARHVAFATPGGRKAGIARALFRMMHEVRVPGPGGMGPLARAVFREGAAALAVRMLVPEAQEQDILELEPRRLTALRGKEPLIARELLAALDSGNEAELARFFAADLRDPFLPRGAGRFISDRLFQRLAAELGSLERPLKLAPAEFLQRSRRILGGMTKGGR